MSDIILISKVGLYETVKCAICQNPKQTERGCDGSCQYDKELHSKIVEAVEGIAEQLPRGEWVEQENGIVVCSRCTKIKRDFRVGHDLFCNACGADMRKEGDAE